MPSTWCALPLCAQVSAFIVMAKEQADQEQAIKGQQRMLGCTADSRLLKAAHQFLPGSHLLHGGLLQQQQQQQLHCSSVAMPQTVYPQAQLPVMVDSLAWQQQQQHQQFYGVRSSSGMQSMIPQQQQQLWVAPPGLSQQMVLVSSPAAAAAYNTLGSSMSSASSASTLSAATAAVQSNMSSPAAAGAAYMLCTAPDGQQVLVPISAGDAGSAMPAVYSAADAAMLMQQQVQAQQLLAAQELSNSMAAQQQQQHNMLLLNGAATSQPVQLSVQPQLTTIAGHMAAAHMTTEQHQLQQLQQQLAMSMPVVFGPAGTDCNSMPPASAVAASSAAAALVNMSAASAGHVLTQQTAGAVTNTVSNASATAMLAGPALNAAAAAAPTACASTSFVGDMLRGLDCYTSATVAAAAAAAADRIASPLNPQQQQPQQQLQHVLLAGNRAVAGSLADSNSSSCSPMLGVSGMMFEASNLPAHLGNNSRVGQPRSQSGVTSSHNMSFGGAQMAASPTCSSSSNGSSSSQGFPANECVMYQVY
jgi:hypothetical protein